MSAVRTKCRHCGGKLISEEGVLKCLSCGREQLSKRQARLYYESHKDEICADYQKMGRAATMAKWGMAAATLYSILKKEQIPLKRGSYHSSAPSHNGVLPPLPAYSNEWPLEVQIKWLETYQAIFTLEKQEGVKHA